MDEHHGDTAAVGAIYAALLAGWNARDAAAFARDFTDDGAIIGFDGSMVDGRAAIIAHLGTIFANHLTPRYVAIVRGVTSVTPEVATLRAVTGLIPHSQTDLNPQLNAIQTLLAVVRDGRWQIALLQTTPAQFHGRPADAQALTDELRRASTR